MLDSVAFEENVLKSRRALAAWQWMSKLSARPEEVARLLHTEARRLAVMALERPEKAASVIQLIQAYRQLATAVQKHRHPASGLSEKALDMS